jgi:DNA polymerase-3 subunit alpha
MESLGVSEYLMTKYAGKETKSQYRELDNHGLIKELCNKVENKSMNIVEQVKFDMEYLEYTTYTNSQIADYYWIVINFITYADPCKPTLVLRNINNGEEIKTRIKQAKIFKNQPFGQFSILHIDGFTYDFKKKMVDGHWENTNEKEPILEEYELIKNV